MAVIDFNVDPYYDDFESVAKDKGYHRVLFRPGFPVQARELTQIQSLLQKQIERFGKHIFEDGSMVIPGDINFDLEYDFIKLQSTFNAQNVESYRTDFMNKIITGSETGVKARVIGTVAATSSDPLTLYIKYEDSGSDNDTKVFSDGENITSLNADNTTVSNPLLSANQSTELNASLLPNSATGTGSACKVNEGIYFINGFFVRNSTQIILLDKYTNTPTYRIGFKIVQSTVTPEEDETLKDNAQGASNFAAPGAHRYKIDLVLEKRTLESTTNTNFVELARLDNGVVQKHVKKTDYAIIQEELARRTYDESGDYEVKPFKLDVREHLASGSNRGIFTSVAGGSASKLALGIEPGKAYVQGFEVELQATRFVGVDKPRTFDRETDTPIQTPVGNYVIVKNLTGMPEVDDFGALYIYDDLLSGSPSQIGTARVRGVELHSGDYDDGAETEFKLGVFDIQMNEGKSFERHARAFGDNATAASATFTADISPNLVSLTGTATSTTGGTGVTGQGSLFNSQLQAGDMIYIDDTFIGEVSSITNNLSLTLTANGDSAKTAGSLKRFSAEVVRPDHKILVFDTNYFRMRKIRGDSTANPDNVKSTAYTVRRKFSTETVENDSISITLAGADETFGSISDLKNYTVIINTDASAGGDTGKVVTLTTSALSLSGEDNTLTIDFSALSSGTIPADDDTVDVIASVRVSGDDAVEKSKTLNLNEEATVSTQSAAQKTEITLGKADGYQLKHVYMAPDFSTDATTSHPDIKDRYEFDSGMRDAYYDLARIKLKSGNPAPTGRLKIVYDYFSHDAGDYFSVDSYSGIDYEDIPQYKSSGNDGRTFDLRDCLDFRPRIDDNGVNFTSSGASRVELPKIGENVEADFSYYLGRIDKVIANFDGEIKIIEGVPAVNPRPPRDADKGMTLFEVEYLPYVINTTEVVAKKINNRRYTMRDIGRIEQRVSNLEYYTSLNLLEKETADLVVKDAEGNDRLKNGFIVDPFTGHGIGNVLSEDYRIAVDMKRKIARPMAHTEVIPMTETATSDAERTSAGYKIHRDGIITAPYTELSYISNPFASESADVNPYKVAPYTGELILTPYSDDWHDTTRRPDLVVVDDNNFDAIQFLADEIGVEGTVWNSWQDNWFGETQWTGERRVGNTTRGGWNGRLMQQTGTVEVGQVRSGIETTLQSSTVNQNLGDRIVSVSMIPYIRPNPVHVYANNMKPRTKLFAFFDNVNVGAYMKPNDVFSIESNNRSDFEFNNFPNVGAQAQSDTARYHNDDQVAAFAFGDVIKNQAHTATSVTDVQQSGNTTTITLSSVVGISVGHHIQFTSIGGATELNYTESKGNNYIVASISGSDITITDLDGTTVESLTAYTSGGSAQRLRASAVVSYQKPDNVAEEDGMPLDIYVSNVKNGFAVDDLCTGTVANVDGNINQCTIKGINGTTATDTVPTMKVLGDDVITDDQGVVNAVFYIPNTDAVRFRTGDRAFRLIDNVNNNPEIGLHSTKAERVYRATGIAEERETTILSVRQAEFVRDRVQDNRTITRNVNGSIRFQRTSRVQSSNGGGSGGGGGGGGHDPLAQTFVINNVFDGVFVTKLDLYFAATGSRPVIVQLLDTKDGNPGQKILAQKILPVESINTSTDATVATTFEFDSPVFMQQDQTYAIAIKVDEPGCRVYFSELGGTNLSDGSFISSNPLTGTMFLSQNGDTWTPQQTRDIKFTLYRAEFASASGTVEFKNSTVSRVDLQTNPFETAPNTNKVRVYQRNHGFRNNDEVTITGVPNGFYGANSTTNGIPATELNGIHVVSDVTMDTYTIEVTSGNVVGGISGLSSDFVGGTSVRASRNIVADIIQPTISQVKLPDTTLSYDIDIADTSDTMSGYINVQENDNYYPKNRKNILSTDNLANNDTLNTQGYTARLRATLQTLNNYTTPVIDSQRVSLCMIANRIDDVSESDVNVDAFDLRTVVDGETTIAFSNTDSTITTANSDQKAELLTLDIGKTITVTGASNAGNNKDYEVINIRDDGGTIEVSPAPGTNESASSSVTIKQSEKFLSDKAPVGASNKANYVTRRFTLENPSTALKIMYEMNRPSGTNVDVYYKILKDGDDRAFDSIPYVQATIDVTDSPDENDTIFRERVHTVSELDSFSSVAVKLVFKSTNTAYVPKIKNLRVLALAV